MVSDAVFDGVAIVSCDIVRHSEAPDGDQVARVAAINDIVAGVIGSCTAGDIVWSSGGDGGHIIFRQQSWQPRAIQLILDFYHWAKSENVRLRIVGHYGEVTCISGADGRIQPVGSGINFAGWLLTQGTQAGVVVSDPFRAEIEAADTGLAIRFDDPRFIPHITLAQHLLYLMSIDDMRSAWSTAAPGDRAALELAVQQEGGWDVLYFAKRIWQAYAADQRVEWALETVRSHHFRYSDTRGSREDVNPFFGHLRSDELKDVLRLGQLIERRRDDVICRYDETGDTMFVILRGMVGVYNSEGTGLEQATDPKHVLRRGEIVGELAYALSRNRTADLVALSDVALLSFNYEDIRSRLANMEIGQAVAAQVSAYINYRVLQHASDNATYLLGHDRSGPLAVAEGGSWDYALTILRRYCELVDVDRGVLDLTLDKLPAQVTARKGLFILAAGTLRARDSDDVSLRGADFPVLWVDVPKMLSLPLRSYSVLEEPVKVLHIAAEGIDKLEARQRDALRSALPRVTNRRQGDRYEFDVYLCHSKKDSVVVSEIDQRLTDAGIKCWFDKDRIRFGDSVTGKIEEGLRSSRFLLACVSANFKDAYWALEEYRTIRHLDVKRPNYNAVLVLMLNEDEDKDEAIPPLARDARRIIYSREDEFDELIEYILSSRPE